MSRITSQEPSLSEELAEVQQATGWHCWHSDEGRCYGTCDHPPYPDASGVTVDAPTPGLLRHEIAVTEHQWLAAA